MKRIAQFVLLLLLTTTLAAKTVIFVRHAEKGPGEPDPQLSDAGHARAQELARVLADAKIGTIYVTQYHRTQDTATPLAQQLGLTPKVVKAGKEHNYAKTMVEEIRKDASEIILVVSHSNSTVDVMRELGVRELPTIPESQFDSLFVCTLRENGPPSMVALRFGAPAR
ncbi:MAG: phosphoglycerate mutase family protein [Thermoanaerobaculia bacterium]